MMKKVFFCLALLGFLACSDDPSDGEGGGIYPAVTLEDVTSGDDPTMLSVLVTPRNAVSCSWICAPESEAYYDAGDIFALGRALSASSPTTVAVDGLKPESSYVFSVAVESASGKRSVETLPLTTGEEPAEVLSGFANTHIVSSAGTFGFETRKVSGEPIEGIVSADWLWMTKTAGDDEPSVVSDIRFSDGKIYFKTTEQEGCALVAALDVSGDILWSWLVWVTDRPGTVTYGNGSVFLDRYIGATSADTGSSESYGLFYQWGRKDPFWGGTLDEIEAGDIPFEAAKAETIVNPACGTAWKFVPEGADIARSIAEPMSYFVHSNYDWLIEHDETLWGPEKTDYDPCPAGYRVPLISEMADLAALKANADETEYVYEWAGGRDSYPAHGCRDVKGVLVLSPVVFVWSATTYPFESAGVTKYFSTRLVASSFFTDINAMGNRCFGQPVRCVAE